MAWNETVKKLHKRGISRSKRVVISENGTKVILYLTRAKKNTPISQRYIYDKRYVHVGTYVPKTKKSFIIKQIKYAAKPKRKTIKKSIFGNFGNW